MADVKISLKIDDAGALEQIKQFNLAFKQIGMSADKASAGMNGITKATARANKQFVSLGKKAKVGIDSLTTGVKKAKNETTGLGKAFSSVKNIATGVFIADTLRQGITSIKNAVVGAVDEFRQFEVGLVAVGKTANISGEELDKLGDAVLNLDIPVDNRRLLELAKVAGQLGVKGSSNILKFATTLGKLESATDIAGEEGAAQLARILNVTKEGADTVDVFGSVIVALGNNFAATESEILRVTNEVARSTAQFGVSSAEAAAFGATLKSLGIQAEGGGTAIGKLFRKLASAVADGGPALDTFAKQIGVTQEGLANLFKSNPTEAAVKFLESLGKLDKIQTGKVLGEVGLNTDRIAKVLPPLAGRVDELRRAFSLANAEINDTKALNEEAATAFDTLDGDVKALTKSWDSLTTQIVKGPLGDALRLIAQQAKEFVDTFRDFTPLEQADRNVVKIAKLRESLEKTQATLEELEEDGNVFERSFKTAQLENKIKNINKEISALIQKNLELRGAGEGELPTPAGTADATDTDAAVAAEEEKEKQQKLLDIRAAYAEAEKQQKAEDATFDQATQDERLQRLIDGLGTERTIKVTARVKELQDQKKFEEAGRELLKADTEARAAIKKRNEQKELEQKRKFSGQLATLARSENKTLAAIGKAGAIAQIAVKTPEAIASSFAYGARIGGPPLGFIFGAIAAAAQAQQAASVAGVNFQDGGIVPGSSFSGDNVQANVNSGEMVLNRQQQTSLFNLANNNSGGQGSREIVVNTSVQVGEEEIARAVSRQVANGFELGEQT